MNRRRPRLLGTAAGLLAASLTLVALGQPPPAPPEAAPEPADPDADEAPPEPPKAEPAPPKTEPAPPKTEPAPPPVDPQEACMGAFGRSQRLRRQGRLLEGRDELLRCAQASCMDVIRNKCLEWLEQVESDLPTVVIAVVGRDGQPPDDATILVDGTPAPDAAGGRAFPLDPGEHIVRVALADGESDKRVVTVLQGQKNQSLIFDFQPPPPPSSTVAPVTIVQSSRVNVPAAIAFGVGGASLLAGIITGAIALDDGADLETRCNSTGCTQDEIDRGLAVAHASTATLAIGAVGMALGVTFLFVFDDEEEDLSAGLVVGPGGASLTLPF